MFFNCLNIKNRIGNLDVFSRGSILRLAAKMGICSLIFILSLSKSVSAFTPGGDSNFEYSLSDPSIVPGAEQGSLFITKGSPSVIQGAFNYEIPVYVPPTTNDIAPYLRLNYSSRNPKDSHFGVGWQLVGVGAISRCRATFATEGVQAKKSNPKYSTGDRLCLNGQKLILANGPHDAGDVAYWAPDAVYKTEIDTFAKVVANANHTEFKVYLKNGLIQTYGGENTSRKAIYYRPGFVSGSRDDIQQWALSKVVDRYNNKFVVDYNYNTSDYEHYIKAISVEPNVRIDFIYENKAYPKSGFDKGYKFVKRKLLNTIRVSKGDIYFGPTAVVQNHVANIREYQLNYSGTIGSGIGRRPKLEAITECGFSDQDAIDCGLPLTFEWSEGNSNYYTNIEGDGGVYRDKDFDGYTENTDIEHSIQLADGWGYFEQENLSSGWRLLLHRKTFGSGDSTDIIHTSTNTSSRPQIADLNGDGLSDLCIDDTTYVQDPVTGDFIQSAWPNLSCSVDSAHSLKITDINSDGLNDFVFISPEANDTGSLGSLVNLGDPSFQNWSGQTSTLVETEQNADLSIELEHGGYGTLADLNGDGLKDLVYAAGTLKYRLNTGYGLGPELSTGISVSNGWGIAYDCDRDGLEDYLHVTWESKSYRSYFDENGNVGLTPGANCWLPDGGDINNDGLHDSRYGFAPYDFYTTAMRGQAELVASITDGLGHQLQVTYNHLVSEKHYKFIAPGQPVEGRGDWYGADIYTPNPQTRYPYKPVDRSMSVVTELATDNGNGGKNTSFYYYTGGKVDTRGRGFLGFSNIVVSQQNDKSYMDENFFHHYTSTTYYQNFPLTGRVLKTETYTGVFDYDKVSEQIFSYETHPLNPEFVYEDHRFQQNFENGQSINSSHTTFTYNKYGNLTASGTVRGKDRTTSSGNYIVGSPVHRSHTENLFTDDEEDHLLGFLRYTRTYSQFEDGSDVRTRCQTFQQQENTLDVYLSFDNCDWNPSNGKAAQQNVFIRNSKGVVTQIQSTATDPELAYPTRTITYGDFEYDIYPRQITNNLGHTTNLEFDQRHSSVSKITDANGFASTIKFDPWGRAVSQLDEATKNLSETSLVACDASCPSIAAYYSSVRTTNQYQEGVAAPISKIFYDMLGREVRTQAYTQGGVVKTDRVYFDRGVVHKVSEPYTGAVPTDWTSYKYDAQGRELLVQRPDGSSAEKIYSMSGGELKVTIKTRNVTPNGHKITQKDLQVNSLGQVRRMTEEMNNFVDYTYNTHGKLATTKVNGDAATRVTVNYDDMGNKQQVIDPDSGTIDFEYNGFGELRFRHWAKNVANKSMEFRYDGLGRKEQRIDTNRDGQQERFNWEWDTELYGALSAAYREDYEIGQFYNYNSKGFVSSVGPWRGASTPKFNYLYDDFGRVSFIGYPLGGLAIEPKYNQLGEYVRTVNVASQSSIWERGDQLDQRGNYTHQRYGNGIVTERNFDLISGVATIESGVGSAAYVQSNTYDFDSLGNLHSRELKRISPFGSVLSTQAENFEYDDLYRLVSDGTSDSTSPCGNNYCYDSLGNLTYKSDVGMLFYSQTDGAGVHAVTSGGGYSYKYDEYGNMVQRGTETVEYNVFNKPVQIEDTSFLYGADHELLSQLSYETNTQTYYLRGMFGEKFEAIVHANGEEDYRHYVNGIMLYETDNNFGPSKTSYLHYDHLGSVESITDSNGNVRSYLSYNAWGERRNEDWTPGDPTMGLAYFYETQTGFTGHETLDHLGLIHMGGRVYDPVVSRFMSADLIVQEPYNSQSYNRYSYVSNNPLSFTDPTGYAKDRYEDLLIVYPDDAWGTDLSSFSPNDNACTGSNCTWEPGSSEGVLTYHRGGPSTRSSTSVSFSAGGTGESYGGHGGGGGGSTNKKTAQISGPESNQLTEPHLGKDLVSLISDPAQYAQCTVECAKQVFDGQMALKMGVVASGVNVLSTRTKPGGATQGTSLASKFFRSIFGTRKFSGSVRAPTLKLGLSAKTASIGGAAGRWTSVLAVASLYPEARQMDFCMATCMRPDD